MIVSGLVGIDDQGSFYRAVIESQLTQGQDGAPGKQGVSPIIPAPVT